MIPDNRFQLATELDLRNLRYRVEMAVPSEWIVRDDQEPDNLILVYVSADGHGDTINLGCECLRGAQDLPCDHAREVLLEIQGQPAIVEQLRQVAA